MPGGSCPEGRPVAVESRHVTRVPWLRLCRARLHCHRLQSPQRHWEQERRIGSHPPQFDKSAWLKATILDSICCTWLAANLRSRRVSFVAKMPTIVAPVDPVSSTFASQSHKTCVTHMYVSTRGVSAARRVHTQVGYAEIPRRPASTATWTGTRGRVT